MPQPTLDLSSLVAAVDRSVGVKASAVTLIEGFVARITEAVRVALEADDNADQASFDAAKAAIDAEAAKLTTGADALAAAIANHPA